MTTHLHIGEPVIIRDAFDNSLRVGMTVDQDVDNVLVLVGRNNEWVTRKQLLRGNSQEDRAMAMALQVHQWIVDNSCIRDRYIYR